MFLNGTLLTEFVWILECRGPQSRLKGPRMKVKGPRMKEWMEGAQSSGAVEWGICWILTWGRGWLSLT